MRKKTVIIGSILLFLAIILIAARLYLGTWLLDYVNSVLNNIDGYKGSVESIDIDLYRGAYKIHNLKLDKKAGKDIPVPFIDINQVDFSVDWKSLLHGRVVSHADLVKPVLNFAVGKSGETKQTGAGVDWTQPIKALMPIDINYVTFQEGELTYRDFSTTPKVDVYIHHMHGRINNLRNVVEASQPLPSTVSLSGTSIGEGNLKMEGRMNILKDIPDMDITAELDNVNLQALTDYTNAYAAVDIKGGKLTVDCKFIVKDSKVSGYVKPIATHVSLIDLDKDANPVKVAWESVMSLVVKLFTNIPTDQFATKVELQGDLKHVDTDTWSTINGILHNAFVKALKKGIEPDTSGAAPAPK